MVSTCLAQRPRATLYPEQVDVDEGLEFGDEPGQLPDKRSYVLPRHRVVFVSVAKNACTALKWMLARLSGQDEERFFAQPLMKVDPAFTIHRRGVWQDVPTLGSLTPEELAEIHPDNGWFVLASPATRAPGCSPPGSRSSCSASRPTSRPPTSRSSRGCRPRWTTSWRTSRPSCASCTTTPPPAHSSEHPLPVAVRPAPDRAPALLAGVRRARARRAAGRPDRTPAPPRDRSTPPSSAPSTAPRCVLTRCCTPTESAS